MHRFFPMAALLCLMSSSTWARTYCIDPVKGDDAAEGTTMAPWKTPTPLNKQPLKAGDKVVLKPGEMHGSLAPVVKGSDDNPVQIVFSAGVYDWHAEGLNEEKLHISNTNDAPDIPKRIMIDLHDANHLVVSGKGAMLRCHGRLMEIHMETCSHITFKDFAIDYARPTVSEYTAEEVGEDSAVFSIHPDSKYRITEDGHLRWVGEGWDEAPGGFVQQYTANPLCVFNCGSKKGLIGRVEEITPYKVRMYYKDGSNPGFVQGATYQHRQVRREYASVFCNRSSDITYDGISLHFMHGMGVVSQFSKNMTFRNVTIAPRKGSGRTCASWADMLHFSGCSGQITVKNVFFSGAHDDAINVHGTHLQIAEIRDRRHIRVCFKHRQTWGFEAFAKDDEVDFISGKSLTSKGLNKVKEATLSPDGRSMELTLTDNIPADTETGCDVVENVTATPAVTVSKCRVQCIPTRAFLLTTRRPIIIKDNVFVRTHHSALLISDDARSWYESGMSKDVTISGNTFDHCTEPVISVTPENREHSGPVHTGLRILNNKFLLNRQHAIKLKSAADVLIKGNNYSGHKATDCVEQYNCTNVRIEN